MMRSRRYLARLLLALVFLAASGVALFMYLASPVPEGPVRVGSLCNAGETIAFLPIQNPGATPLQIAGWRIHDSQGGAALPSFTLAPNGIARIWSADEAHAVTPPRLSDQIVGLDPSDAPIQDIYVGRAQPGWAVDVAIQAAGLFRPQSAPKFFHMSCDPALSVLSVGKIIAAGMDITAMRDAQLTEYRRHRIGFVFQFYNLMWKG